MKTLRQEIQIHAVGVASLLALAMMTYFLGIKPILNTRSQIQEYKDENRQLVSQTPDFIKANARLSKEIRAKEAELQEAYPLRFESELYGDREPILKLVSLLLTRRELEMVNFREQSNTEDSIEVEVQSKGQYQAVVGLIHDLRQLDRPVRILKWDFNPLDNFGKHFGVNFTLRFVASDKRPISASKIGQSGTNKNMQRKKSTSTLASK